MELSAAEKIGMFCDPSLKAVSNCLVAFVSSVAHDLFFENDRQSHNDENQESCVFLFGAVGRCGDAINGAYDMTDDVADGFHIYAKRDNDGLIIEHHEGYWGVKHLRELGTAATIAHVEGGCAIDLCASRPWYVADENSGKMKQSRGSRSYSGTFAISRNIKMLIGSDAAREV